MRPLRITILIVSLIILGGSLLWWYTFYSTSQNPEYMGNASQQGYILPTNKFRFQLARSNSNYVVSIVNASGESVSLDATSSEPMQLFFEDWGRDQSGGLVPPVGCEFLRISIDKSEIETSSAVSQLDLGLECFVSLQVNEGI